MRRLLLAAVLIVAATVATGCDDPCKGKPTHEVLVPVWTGKTTTFIYEEEC